MHYRLLPACLATILYSAHLSTSYAITTTTIFKYAQTMSSIEHAMTIPSTPPPSTSTSTVLLTVSASPKPCTNTTNSTSNPIPLPLTANQSTALFSLLNLIPPSQIPSSPRQTGSTISTFFQNISSCISSENSAIKASILSLGSDITGIADGIEADITGAIAAAPSLLSLIENAGASLVGDVTSFGGSVLSKATGLGGSALSEVTSAVVPVATSLLGDLGIHVRERSAAPFLSDTRDSTQKARNNETVVLQDLLGDLDYLKRLHMAATGNRAVDIYASAPLQPRGAINDLESLASQISTISACISNKLNSNPVFEIGKCALKLAELVVPAAKLLKLKDEVAAAGGVAKTVETFRAVGSVGEAVSKGGAVLGEVFKDISGINNVVDDCKILV